MGGDLYPETALRPAPSDLFDRCECVRVRTCRRASRRPRRPRHPAATEKAAEAEEVEFPEFAVAPAELANHNVDDIVQVAASERDGRAARDRRSTPRTVPPVTARNWVAAREAHSAQSRPTPDWLFSGDHLQTGGVVKLPSDVEWTVLYGIRNEHPKTRGLEADMVAYLPENRNEHDTEAYGNRALPDRRRDRRRRRIRDADQRPAGERIAAKAGRGRVPVPGSRQLLRLPRR